MTINKTLQIEDWNQLHKLFNDSSRLHKSVQREFLVKEVYPLLKEYVTKYGEKYDHLNKPKCEI